MNNLLAGMNLGDFSNFGAVKSWIIYIIQPKPLVEIKAGRMNFDGRVVKPDRRRGLIRVI